MSERDMQRLLALVAKALGKEWVDLGDWLRSLPENEIAAIEARLYTYDTLTIVAQVNEAARTFAAASHAEYVRAGQAAAKWLDEQPSLAERLVRFDATNDRAVRQAQRNELKLVRGLTSEARETIQTVMIEGQRAGANPRVIARDIRDTLTLTPTQAKHVVSYRRALESGDYTAALSRESRDARSDRTLRRLRRDGDSLTEQQVDRMVDRYRDQKLTERAYAIATTESSKNVHRGVAEAHRQAIERGDVTADQLVKEWLPGPRRRYSRDQHRTSALLDQRPIVTEPFVMADGTRMMYPGEGPAEHVIHCACTYAVRLEIRA